MESGAEVDGADYDDQAPLISASEQGHLKMVHLLLGKAADMSPADTTDRTALIVALDGGDSRVAELLRAAGTRHSRVRLGRSGNRR